MASFKEKLNSSEKKLLEDVKNYLDRTFEDEEYDRNLYGIICNGKKVLNDLCGSKQDYGKEGKERSLLFDYCRYAVNKNLEFFRRNFREELIDLVLDKEVETYASGQV